jgi:biotin carboxyl carrier protein
MVNSKYMALFVGIFVLMAAVWVLAADGPVDQTSVLAGKVLATGLVATGTTVHEGDILVDVDSIAGPAPAVRANVDGLVKEVLIKPGDMIHTGEILVRIQPEHK